MVIRRQSSSSEAADDRRLAFNVLGNYVIKGISMLVALVMVPAYMSYFGSQSILGVWFTIVALLNWVLLFDFGIGSGVRNKLVELVAVGDHDGTNSLIVSAYISIAAIVILLVIISVPVVLLLDWHTLLGVTVTDISRDTLIITVLVSLAGVYVRFCTVIVSHIFYALQKAVIPSLLILISNILVLLYLIVVPSNYSETGLIVLAAVTAVANNLPGFVATIVIMNKRHLGISFRLRYFDKDSAKSVISLGGALFYLQIVLALVFQVKEIFIAFFVGSAQVVDYQIYYKLIGIVGGLFALALAPTWSAVTKAKVDGNVSWISKLFKKGTFFVAVFSLGQLVLVVLMSPIVKIWLGDNAIEVSYVFGLIYCLYNVLYMWVMLNYNFMCGLGRLKVTGVCLTIAAILNFALAWLFSCFDSTWVSVIVATTIAIIPCAIFIPLDLRSYLYRLSSEGGSDDERD